MHNADFDCAVVHEYANVTEVVLAASCLCKQWPRERMAEGECPSFKWGAWNKEKALFAPKGGERTEREGERERESERDIERERDIDAWTE